MFYSVMEMKSSIKLSFQNVLHLDGTIIKAGNNSNIVILSEDRHQRLTEGLCQQEFHLFIQFHLEQSYTGTGKENFL